MTTIKPVAGVLHNLPPLPSPEYDRCETASGVRLFSEDQMCDFAREHEVAVTARLAEAAQEAKAERCPNCDDVGDVHSIDGEWRGVCHCSAGDKLRASTPPAPTQQAEPHTFGSIMHVALEAIATTPMAEHDDLLAASMRNVAQAALACRPAVQADPG